MQALQAEHGRSNRKGWQANLVVAAYEVHSLGVLQLERQQQADGLQGVRAPVHIVAQE